MAKPRVTVGLAIPPKPPTSALNQTIWASRALGFDSLLLWDHLQDIFPKSYWDKSFTWAAGQNKSPHEFFEQQTTLGYMAAKAGRMRVGVAVTDPVRRHPVIIAQSMLTLSHLAKRAPILGIGSGEAENITPYGLPLTFGVSRLEEALQVIRLCFSSTGAALNFEGTYFQLQDAVFDLKAAKGKQPDIWVGALGPRMLELTGKYADGWYPLGMMSPDEYGEKLGIIHAAASAANRNPNSVLPTLQPYIVVAPTTAEARALLKNKTIRYFGLLTPAAQWRKLGYAHPFGEEFRGNIDFLPEAHTRSELDEALAQVPDGLEAVGLFVGSPEDIANQLQPFVDRGLRYVVPQAMTAAISRKHALYSLRAVRQIGKLLNQ